jgi:tRNA threonylcarbamoyl adenosine modification protein YeaZ
VLILAFDTATRVATSALLRDGDVLGERRSEARAVLEQAHALLAEAGAEPGDLDAIVVGTGPGSFTGVRMGLAAARGLGLALELPGAGVSTLLGFDLDEVEPVLDARRGEVFTSGPRVARPEELSVDRRHLAGDGAIRYRELFAAAGAQIPPDDDPVHLPSPALLVARAAGAFGPIEAIEPLYVRAPDAKEPR